jgi:viologen exporter family transport system permease protein
MTAVPLDGHGRVSVNRNLPAYLEIVRSRIKISLAYRQNSLCLLGIVVVQIFILRKVWGALYATQSSVSGLDRHALLVYLTIANLQTWVLIDPTVSRYMYERVREGLIAFDLVRPTGFVQQMFAQLAGSALSSLLFIIPALPLVALAGTLGGPQSWTAGAGYAVSVSFGCAIAMLLSLLIGMVAFWTTEIQGLVFLYRLVSQFLAGTLVPLSFFPSTLRWFAEAMPFQSTTYTPVAIYVGRLSGAGMAEGIAVQIAWTAGLAFVAWAMWHRALFHVVVQGG